MFKSDQDVQWHQSRSVQVADGKWEMQPEEELCRKCGQVIYSNVNEPDKKKLIRLAQSNRAERAKVMLLHEVIAGNLPKGFILKCCKTTNECGLENKHCVPTLR